ncbi:GAF domain nucleotide-binding protein [Saccharata proteae CBS 121410]|uniref:GAF domain nucleotide-binding protein n=1 Tax=Saccharata proteae CBS 121410 TaxID=1314787 RepID=A0A9P4LSK8_9PEZI|nr:GAF domain nucleotide-binding protein [Saccharata proteae CBS 121410]
MVGGGLLLFATAEPAALTPGLSKAEVYGQVLDQARALLDGQRNWVRANNNFANVSSLVYHALHSLPAPSSAVNWCGFYFLDPSTPEQLILGPFQGHVACQTIRFGRGVCGAAVATGQTQLVPDVEAFPGHIACDSASKSEIVVPIIQREKVVAIIDIDCADLSGFDTEDQKYLEELAALLAEACDF